MEKRNDTKVQEYIGNEFNPKPYTSRTSPTILDISSINREIIEVANPNYHPTKYVKIMPSQFDLVDCINKTVDNVVYGTSNAFQKAKSSGKTLLSDLKEKAEALSQSKPFFNTLYTIGGVEFAGTMSYALHLMNNKNDMNGALAFGGLALLAELGLLSTYKAQKLTKLNSQINQ